MAAMRDRFVQRLAARLDAGLPPIALVGPGWSWRSDTGAEQGAEQGADDAVVEVRAPDFELARALMARRSAAQLRAWTVRGDVEPYLDAFATLGSLPGRDLTE